MGLSPGSLTNQGTGSLVCVNQLTHKVSDTHPLVCITALQGLRDCAQIQPGQQLLIVGASGGVGTYAIQLAKHMGAHVTAVCSGRNAELVKDLGADAVIDYTTTDALETDFPYDVVYDVVGSHTLTTAKCTLKDTGVYMTLVPAEPDIEFFFPGRTKCQAGHGYFVIAVANTIDLTDLAERVDAGRLRTHYRQYISSGAHPRCP